MNPQNHNPRVLWTLYAAGEYEVSAQRDIWGFGVCMDGNVPAN